MREKEKKEERRKEGEKKKRKGESRGWCWRETKGRMERRSEREGRHQPYGLIQQRSPKIINLWACCGIIKRVPGSFPFGGGEREREEGGRGVKEKQNALPFLNEAEGYERAEATSEERNAATNAPRRCANGTPADRQTDGRTDRRTEWMDRHRG